MTQRPQAQARLVEDNDRVAIREWRFAPGAETGWHVHDRDYVVVYRTRAAHLVETLEGGIMVDAAEGHSYFRRKGVEHNVVNVGSDDVVLMEIELKEASPA
jgi:quercetin dioxygenase-like cupin family protein